jgi:hypothetical protein
MPVDVNPLWSLMLERDWTAGIEPGDLVTDSARTRRTQEVWTPRHLRKVLARARDARFARSRTGLDSGRPSPS